MKTGAFLAVSAFLGVAIAGACSGAVEFQGSTAARVTAISSRMGGLSGGWRVREVDLFPKIWRFWGEVS